MSQFFQTPPPKRLNSSKLFLLCHSLSNHSKHPQFSSEHVPIIPNSFLFHTRPKTHPNYFKLHSSFSKDHIKASKHVQILLNSSLLRQNPTQTLPNSQLCKTPSNSPPPHHLKLTTLLSNRPNFSQLVPTRPVCLGDDAAGPDQQPAHGGLREQEGPRPQERQRTR